MRIVEHYDIEFPVEGNFCGFYGDQPCIVSIENSTPNLVTTPRDFFVQDQIDKNKLKVVIK